MTVSKRLTFWNRRLLSYGVGKVAGIFLQAKRIFYVSRSIPSDIQHRFKKRKIEVSLRTKPDTKATKPAASLPDRLERYWDNLRMEMIYSHELDLKVLQDTKSRTRAMNTACQTHWRYITA